MTYKNIIEPGFSNWVCNSGVSVVTFTRSSSVFSLSLSHARATFNKIVPNSEPKFSGSHQSSGGLNEISWFQFLPHESEFSSLADKSVKIDQKDAGAMLVLSSHLQLQKEGFLSTWTNSFVGPWDPSQGLHNPDEKIKLWLFLPGHHTSIVDKAKPFVSHLRVLGSGLWVAPGESEEVAAALSQALKNSIERALRGYSYIRFGDVFSRYHPSSPSEELFRRGHPVLEFVFSATEEAIFVHVMISAKHVRALSSGDMEAVFHQSTKRSGVTLPVLVSPNGMHGRLTGCCPNDLVKQVYLSSGKLSDNEVVGLEKKVSQGSSSQLGGKSCYAEVTIGCPDSAGDKLLQRSSSSIKNIVKKHVSETPATGRVGHGCFPDQASFSERVLIYPIEAVLVPVMQTSPAKSYLKRFWLQNWIGPSLSGTSIFMHCNRKLDYKDGCWHELKSIRSQLLCHSSSNSNSSSVSNITSSSSKTSGSGDLEADADSLACRQSGLSSVGQSNNDTLKSGSKRTRAGISESFSQLGTVVNPLTNGEVNTSTITGATNDPTGRQYGWDDDEPGVCMDIQALLTEFGDFGDFFENDILPFGEPPGTAESHTLMSTTPDCGDVNSSPCTTSMMDVSDQMLMPIGMTSLDSFNPPPQLKEDSFSMIEEVLNNGGTSSQADCTLTSINTEFDHLVKAEVMLTFAPEYGAVETPNSEVCSSIFRSPYVPNSRKAETATSSSNSYVYSAKPPSPRFKGSNDKSGSLVLAKARGRQNSGPALQLEQYYTHVESGRDATDNKLLASTKVDHGTVLAASTSFPGSNYTKAVNSDDANIFGDPLKTNSFFPFAKSVLASEVECLMYQAFMCKIRHTLFSSSSPLPVGLTRSSGSIVLNRSHVDPSTTADHKSSRYEVKKQEQIPVRIAGDIGGGALDGSFSTPVGVWRSVGVPRTGIPTSNIEVSSSVPQYSFLEESMLSYGLRQPLHEFLDGMALLVQQGTSFVDLALDADCTDGPFSWLALQEQWRRGFCCGPSKVHAGCGGMLSSGHSLDISGVELVDPYSIDVQASLTISLLQSDIKSALKSAFGTLDGPLSISDWCRGRSLEAGNIGDGFSAESTASPSEDGTRMDETSEKRSNQEAYTSESEHQSGARVRPTLAVVPFPAILVGYQDDWLKCSASSLKFWEKAPFEPYASQKHMTYYVVCPDIDPLTTAAADFFQQLGTVYETCKLGVHSPQSLGNEMDIDSGKLASSGFVLLDCPQSMKIDSSTASMLGSISDYFLSLSNGWDVASFLKSLSKVLKTLKLVSCLATNSKEGNSGACVVVYVVCPFPEPLAVLQTLIESSVALGSVLFSSDKERRSMLYNQVGKALSHLAAVDETLSNVVALSGSSIPKLVLQIVTVDAIFRVTSPALNELTVLKEIAFTVYNKARRVSRGSSHTMVPPSSSSDRSHSSLMHMTTPASGLWKDCVPPRVTGSSLQRESEVESSLRTGTWENSWQTSRIGGMGYDPIRIGDIPVQEALHYMFEPLFILAEPGSLDRAVLPPVFSNTSESSRLSLDYSTSSNVMQSSASSGTGDIGITSQSDATTEQEFASGSHKTMPSLHCCYGWTEDWRWLVCIWTDSRGELLDSYIYPFGGISGRQDTKGLQSLFIQILQQGCQILQACPADPGFVKARDFVIARIGCFFELECQEWQKALYAVGGSEMKKWSLQLRRSVADGLPSSNNGTSLQQQDMGIQERTLASPNTLYNSQTKASSFMKGGLGQSATRKQMIGGASMSDNSRGLHQWVHSICFVSISVDHSLQLVHQADLTSPGTNQGSGILGQPSYLEGYTPVKSLGSTSASYVLIPSPSLRFLPPSPLQLPTCLTAESPPLAHLLHSKGSAIPLSTGFVVSKAVPSMRKDPLNISKEWPSVLSVGLVDYYGSSSVAQEKFVKNASKLGGKSATSESRDVELEAHLILEGVAAELHALSWMTASPMYLERRSALPFHCDMVLRLRRLLYFADKELSKQTDKS